MATNNDETTVMRRPREVLVTSTLLKSAISVLETTHDILACEAGYPEPATKYWNTQIEYMKALIEDLIQQKGRGL